VLTSNGIGICYSTYFSSGAVPGGAGLYCTIESLGIDYTEIILSLK
jgi:hypothetical protein